MPIAHILTTDTFPQWFAKDNAMIDRVNALGATGEVITVNSPLSGHVLVFDGTTFRNVPMTGDVVINANGQTQVISGGGGTSHGRIYFAGNIRGTY